MDDLDRKLIGLLRIDSREPAASLAAKLKVSRGTVQNRISRLCERGVIRGFTIVTRADAEQPKVRAIMSIAIEGERSAGVIRALRGFPAVDKIHTTNGRWDLIVDLETDSLESFSRTLDGVREIEGISATETSLLLATRAP